MEIGELLINLGFKANTDKLRDFIHDVGDLNISSIIAASGLAGVVDGIKNIMEAADNTARTLNNFNSLTGLSTQELQAWDKVAQESGISAGVLGSTVDGLQNTIQNLKMTGEGGGLFNMLHIDPSQMTDTFTSLKMILTAIEDMPKAQQKWVLTKFGLPEQLVQMIPNLNKINESWTNSDSSLQSMKNFMGQVVDLTYDFKKLMVDIAAILESSFVGYLLKGLDAMVKFLDNAQLLYPILYAISGVLGVMAIRMVTIAVASIAAAMTNPVTSPWAIAALTTGVGAGIFGAMAGMNDNSRTIAMTNHITINGDSAENNMKALDAWHGQILNNANDQQPFPNN